jgi:transposase
MEGDMKYCGIDLHGNNHWVVILDDQDRMVYSKRHANDLSRLLPVLAAHRTDLYGIVVESTFNWYWLVDGLQEAGYRVLLANTAAIKQYEGLKHRGDESDARQLAHLLRLGLLPQGYIMPKAVRAVRDLARKRMQLVQQRTTQILTIESTLSRHSGWKLSSNRIKCLRPADLEELRLDEMPLMGLKSNIAVMQTLQGQIDGLEKVLADYCRTEPGYCHGQCENPHLGKLKTPHPL